MSDFKKKTTISYTLDEKMFKDYLKIAKCEPNKYILVLSRKLLRDRYYCNYDPYIKVKKPKSLKAKEISRIGKKCH